MASQSFRHLIRKPMSEKELFRLFDELAAMPDQAVALVCGALLDRSLERAILSRMTRLRRKYHREIFLGTAPLSIGRQRFESAMRSLSSVLTPMTNLKKLGKYETYLRMLFILSDSPRRVLPLIVRA
jgi:hypothetical protein